MTEIIDEKTKQEWQEQYRTYQAVTPEGFEPFHEARIAPIIYEIPLGSKVLDVGANDGALLQVLKDKRDCEVYGVDMSEVAIAKAKEKGIDVILSDAEHLPFEDATFDVVTLNEVLIHLVNPAIVLKEIRRVLKPSGYLLGSVPHENLEKYIWAEKRMHHRYLDENGLRQFLEVDFPTVYVKTLKGSQFSISFAGTFLADQPAEMLFKCGNDYTLKWEAEALADETLRVWFGYTQLAGTVYYRMLGFAEKMDQLKIAQPAYERAPWSQIDSRASHWQSKIRNRVILNQLENILRVAHLSVWQIVSSRDVLAFLRCAKDAANIYWYKTTGEKKFFVTEIDDNLFDVPSYNIASNPYKPNSELEWVAQKQIEMSDALICSTQFLVDKMTAMFPDKPTFLIPNAIDFDLWDNAEPDQDIEKKSPETIRIGYTGCANHRNDLEMIKEPLIEILKEFPNVQLFTTPQRDPEGMFVGWGLPNVACISKWAQIDKYPSFVKGWDMDIGIAPLLDNDFNRAKSNLRWLEYSAMKIPTVASKVYPFKNSIIDSQDGLICNTSEQWYAALKSLIVDAGRRTQIGRNAYERVKKDFSMDKVAVQYVDILQKIRHDQRPAGS